MLNPGQHLRPSELESLRLRPRNLHLDNCSWWFLGAANKTLPQGAYEPERPSERPRSKNPEETPSYAPAPSSLSKARSNLINMETLHPVFSCGFLFSLIYLFKLEDNYFTILWRYLPYIDIDQSWVHICFPHPEPPSYLSWVLIHCQIMHRSVVSWLLTRLSKSKIGTIITSNLQLRALSLRKAKWQVCWQEENEWWG